MINNSYHFCNIRSAEKVIQVSIGSEHIFDKISDLNLHSDHVLQNGSRNWPDFQVARFQSDCSLASIPTRTDQRKRSMITGNKRWSPTRKKMKRNLLIFSCAKTDWNAIFWFFTCKYFSSYSESWSTHNDPATLAIFSDYLRICYCTYIHLYILSKIKLVLHKLLWMRTYSSLGRIAYASNRSGGLAVLCVLLLLGVPFYSDFSTERSTITRSEDVKNDKIRY